MRFKSASEMAAEISKHEKQVFFKYTHVAEKYREAFSKYQCALLLEMKWYNCMSIKKKVFNDRVPLKGGYICFIDFSLKKNGKNIKVKSDDGEADYYLLEDSLNITEISLPIFCRKANLYSDTVDFENELKYYLEMLQKHYLSKH